MCSEGRTKTDVKLGLRMLYNQPGLTLVAVFALSVPSVIAEVLYVLEDYYELGREEALARARELCALRLLEVEHEAAVLEALAVAQRQGVDFVDALLVHLGKDLEAERVFSFDRGMQQKLSDVLPVTSDPG